METEVIKLSQKNFYNICRICYQQNNLKDIYQSRYQANSLASIFEYFVQQKISESDGLPTHACLNCIKSLLNLTAFLDQFRISTEALRTVYNFLYTPENLANPQKHKRCIRINYTRIPSEESLLQNCTFITPVKLAKPAVKTDVEIKEESPIGFIPIHIPEPNIPLLTNSLASELNSSCHPERKKEFICYICKKVFRNKFKLMKHIETSHSTVQCPNCHLRVAPGSLKMHLTRHEPGYAPSKTVCKKKLCTMCGKYVGSSRMRAHMLCHEIAQPYRCKICPFKTAFSTSLIRHQIKHKGNPLLCNSCGKGYSRKEYLTHHMKSHEAFPEPKQCFICSETSATQFDYKNHKQTHESSPIIKFSNSRNSSRLSKQKRSNLNTEDNQIIRKQTKTCEECGVLCNNYSAYLGHMRVKHKIDKRSCTICGEKVRGHMTSHIKKHHGVHNGKSNFKCISCDKEFGSEFHLKRHILLIHENKRDHKCLYCGKGFNLACNLQEHVRIHTGETLKCIYCYKTFKQKSTRYKHLREVHNVRLGPPRKKIIIDEKLINRTTDIVENFN